MYSPDHVCSTVTHGARLVVNYERNMFSYIALCACKCQSALFPFPALLNPLSNDFHPSRSNRRRAVGATVQDSHSHVYHSAVKGLSLTFSPKLFSKS